MAPLPPLAPSQNPRAQAIHPRYGATGCGGSHHRAPSRGHAPRPAQAAADAAIATPHLVQTTFGAAPAVGATAHSSHPPASHGRSRGPRPTRIAHHIAEFGDARSLATQANASAGVVWTSGSPPDGSRQGSRLPKDPHHATGIPEPDQAQTGAPPIGSAPPALCR